jgi:predicted dehydrogenase
LVFRHGHLGPIEIGVYDEFASWLTDPDANGGGALVDFGCYGAAIATWLMDGQRPTEVRAIVNHTKPGRYPRVDDDATIILTYPTSTAVIQASWAWTHDNKEMDIHGELGSVHAGKWDELTLRRPDAEPEPVIPAAQATAMENEWTYLRHVIRGEYPVDPLSSLEINVIAAEILDAARRDAGLAAPNPAEPE